MGGRAMDEKGKKAGKERRKRWTNVTLMILPVQCRCLFVWSQSDKLPSWKP